MALLSKWVGETERNLDGLFRNARSAGAVLLIDEVDGLLADRSSPNTQRHDLSQVNVLLNLIERHDNLVILCTNLPGELDKALIRRLTYVLCFPMPDAPARAAIWKGLIPPTVPLADPINFDELGRRFQISGAHIKNAVFKAAFRAASNGHCLTYEQLVEAAIEEGNDVRKLEGNGTRSAGFTTPAHH